MDLSDKTILITGAAGGLGSAIALLCAGFGADLVLLDKNRRGLGELSDRITGQGLSVRPGGPKPGTALTPRHADCNLRDRSWSFH